MIKFTISIAVILLVISLVKKRIKANSKHVGTRPSKPPKKHVGTRPSKPPKK